jgi:hypothetical protein
MGWDKLLKHSMEELLSMQGEVMSDPESKNPPGSVAIYTKNAQKKLNDLAWAIQHKVAENKGETIQGSTFTNYKTRR